MGFLSEVATRLQVAEYLRPAVAVHHKADRETRDWDCLSPTSQRVILAASVADRITIPLVPPLSIHCFLNTRNATELQADCTLTYSGNNLLLPTDFCQACLHGHILVFLDTYAPSGLSLLLTPTSSEVQENAQQ